MSGRKKTKLLGLSECCEKCGSKEFSVAISRSAHRTCSKCKFVWLPKSYVEMERDSLRVEVQALRSEIQQLRNKLEDKNEAYYD